MTQLHPDPHAAGYVFIPAGQVTSLFASTDDAKDAVEELARLGYSGNKVDVFIGETGATVLDLSGAAHGTVTRRIRNLEALLVPESGETLRRADAALREGGVFLAVRLTDEQGKEEVAATFSKHHGTVIRYWSRWTIETLDR